MRRGRAPRALVITPTRELANQVSREFQSICPSLAVRAFYGGKILCFDSSFDSMQESLLVGIVVSWKMESMLQLAPQED